jgi:hypothetical protein
MFVECGVSRSLIRARFLDIKARENRENSEKIREIVRKRTVGLKKEAKEFPLFYHDNIV